MTLIIDFNSLERRAFAMAAEQVDACLSHGGAVVYFMDGDTTAPKPFVAPTMENRISVIRCNEAAAGCMQMLKNINMMVRRAERNPNKVVKRFRPQSVALATSHNSVWRRLHNFFGVDRLNMDGLSNA